MNDVVIKGGFYDKGASTNSMGMGGGNNINGSGSANSNSAAETSSARPTIWHGLNQKNHIPLQFLATLYAAVLEKRQILGRYTPTNAATGFKPPPRVTITDSKREAWLRDLANPDVPLRKQSRNIPYGIRGKLLMEQCLGKRIPLARAVWLAKCVGANELRASRRKGATTTSASGSTAAAAGAGVGAGGEDKWIREWTTHIQQFLEGVIATCDQQQQQQSQQPPRESWRERMDYAIKLTTCFYAERLVDQDFFLSWIVSSFARATEDRLPVWIIFVQLYWKELIAHGRRGRKLAGAILQRLEAIAQSDRPRTMVPLRVRLEKLLTMLGSKQRGCLVVPQVWEKYKHLLLSKQNTVQTNVLDASASANISARNERLLGPLSRTTENTHSPILDLYAFLDSLRLHEDFDLEALTLKCQACIPNNTSQPQQLINALLDWSSSIYRVGTSRIFLTARILAQLRLHHQTQQIDTDSYIFSYLRTADPALLYSENLFRVLAELVRLGAFAPGRYMQWLLTSGVVSGENVNLAAGFLHALSTDSLPPHLSGTRAMLIKRVEAGADHGSGLNEELLSDRVATVIEAIANGEDTKVEERRVLKEVLNGTSRLAHRGSAFLPQLAKIDEPTYRLTAFCFVRAVMERCLDGAGLVELVSWACPSVDSTSKTNPEQACAVLETDGKFLAAAADTLARHAATFAVLEKLQPLRAAILVRYRILRTSAPLDRQLIMAVQGLLSSTRKRSSLDGIYADSAQLSTATALKLLAEDLALANQQTALAVCSPASDSLVNMSLAATSNGQLDSDADLDAVFASGNTMDEGLMRRVFTRVVQRAAVAKTSRVDGGGLKVCAWLRQLRALDATALEGIVREYIQSALTNTLEVDGFERMVRGLVVEEYLDLSDVAAAALAGSEKVTMASSALLVFLRGRPAERFLPPMEEYRFAVRRERFVREQGSSIVKLVVAALGAQEGAPITADDADLAELVIGLVASSEQATELRSLIAENIGSPVLTANYGQLLVTSLEHKSRDGSIHRDGNSPFPLNPEQVVQRATPLSIFFCAGMLDLFGRSTAANAAQLTARVQSAVLKAIRAGSEVWPQLLRYSGPEAIRSIYLWARELILPLSGTSSDFGDACSTDEGQTLEILDVAYHATQDANTMVIITTLAEQIKSIEGQLSCPSAATHGVPPEELSKTCDPRVRLPVLLHLSVLYSSSNITTEESETTRRDLLAALCSLLQNPRLHHQHPTSTLEFLFDVASFLADSLPDTALATVARGLPGAARDSRLVSILALNLTTYTWLALATHPASTPAGASQQQRLLAKQTSSASSARGGPPQGQAPTSAASSPSSSQQQPASKASLALMRGSAADSRETKLVPFPLRVWEIIPSVGGENDTSLSLSLFGARKA